MKAIGVMDAKAAGIDVGSERLHVSVGGETGRVFGTMTGALYELRDWLLSEGVRQVAMEATGVYWLVVYEVLSAAGLQVLMVNGRHVKQVPGRKSDMLDCQWLSTLLGHGLLRAGFVPGDLVRRLQDYQRLRQDHVSVAGSHVQHMQKALDRMNLKPHEVISSLTGASGMAMLRAVLDGERDPGQLLKLCNPQIQRKKADALHEAFRGHWKDEHLFALRQAVQAWDFYQTLIAQCDEQIADVLKEMAGPEDPQAPPIARGKPGGTNAPDIPQFHQLLVRACGYKDPTLIPAIGDYSLMQLISEVGTDLSAWANEKRFASWLGLAPAHKQSGKRRRADVKKPNRAGRIFTTIAQSLARTTDKALGGFYRRLRGRRGGPIANKAVARKLATTFWRLMVKGTDYVEQGLAHYTAKARESELRLLRKLAKQQGYELIISDLVQVPG